MQRMVNSLVGLPVKSIGIDPNYVFVLLASICSRLMDGLCFFDTIETAVSNIIADYIY